MGEVGARSFYGGEPLTGGSGSGEISAGRYQGPEAEMHGPWKCPACGANNDGLIPLGCTACGSGKPGYHVDQTPAPAPAMDRSASLNGVVEAINDGDPDPVYQVAYAWHLDHPDHTPIEAFVAGFKAARAQLLAHTMQAAPVTVDVEQLAPEGKPRRTIIAALEIFKDQILSQAPDEITSGEWLSVPEVDELITTLKGQL